MTAPMSDAQKAPAPSAETERAVEVAGEWERCARVAESMVVGNAYEWDSACIAVAEKLRQLSQMRRGRLVARSLKGEG